jgi:hypothetical protein
MNRAARRAKPKPTRPNHRCRIAEALLRRDALGIIAQMRLDANIQALMGANPAACINAAASIMFIVIGAAMAQGMDGSGAELRVIRGAASAAGDCTARLDQATFDQHRQAIISGLQATDRLWPALQEQHLIAQFIRLQSMLASPQGLNLSDFEPETVMEYAQSAIK